MTHEIKVCSQCGLAVVRLAGDVDGDGLYNTFDTLVKTEDWGPGQSDLWDLRAVRDLFIAPGQVLKFSACVPSEWEMQSTGRTALVTRTLTQRAYGNVFFDAINASGRVHRSFHSTKRAARWLRAQSERKNEVDPCERDCPLSSAGHADFASG